jgi:hypothetical protein
MANEGTKGTLKKDWRHIFLDELRDNPNVSEVCDKIKVPRRTAYNHRRDDPIFKADWDEALEEGMGTLEDAGRARAKEKSDTLMIFFLKAHNREKYQDTFKGDIDLKGRMSEPELRKRAQEILAEDDSDE